MVETESASWTAQPLVTGLLAFHRPGQERVTRHSIASFFEQAWPNKELVILNPTNLRLTPFGLRRRIREIKLPILDNWLALSVCHACANGEWCAVWQSDTIYDQEYLTIHMALRHKERLVALNNRQALSLSTNSLSVLSGIDFPAYSFYRHMPVDFRKPLTEQFEVNTVENPASTLTQVVSEIAP
jgi:hypothetical protein